MNQSFIVNHIENMNIILYDLTLNKIGLIDIERKILLISNIYPNNYIYRLLVIYRMEFYILNLLKRYMGRHMQAFSKWAANMEVNHFILKIDK